MATNPDTRQAVAYDPLPLTLSDDPSPPSPRLSSFHTPSQGPPPLPADDNAVPSGAAQPRFIGAALYDPAMRGSIASSHQTHNGSEYSSVYALNDPSAPGYRDDPRESYYPAGEHGSVPMSPVGASRPYMSEKRTAYTSHKSKRKVMIIAIVVAAVLLLLAIIIPIIVFVVKPNSKERSSSSSDPSPTGHSSTTDSAAQPSSTPVIPTSGTDGSEITMEDGTTFTYRNPFGGHWVWDEANPFDNGAKAQSWTPALNETFVYGTTKIRGVNLGGWLNTEPFISPSIYQKYYNNPNRPVDEWTLSVAMRADTAGGGISQMEEHYKTFITEKDFADIAAAGLNYVRIPIGFWAIETREGEPYLEKVSWQYFVKAIKWARKYGLRINLDLHALPGSQNGWNHSGRLGSIGFLMGPMGYANAQRSLDYIRIIAEFISQPQYSDVVTMFGIINEPKGDVFGQDALARFYMESIKVIRTASGTGEGKGPWISLHDGFRPRESWANMYPNADRLSLDTHPYMCFGPQSNRPMSAYVQTPCSDWGARVNTSMAAFGLTNAGEFSNAVTDCGLFLNGVNDGIRYEGTYFTGGFPEIGSCRPWVDWENYDASMKRSLRQFAMASMDALQNYFFWTWRIGPSRTSGKVETPAWSYSLGLENGWMPTDPREADGVCGNTSPWQPPLPAWHTGGVGAGNMPAAATRALAWPPAQFSGNGQTWNVADLPAYTTTGAIPTLTASPFPGAAASADVGNGWANAQDTQLVAVPVSGCTYPNAWVDPNTAVQTACGREVAAPQATPDS